MLLGVSSRSTGGVSIPVLNAVLLLVAKARRNAVSWRARANLLQMAPSVCV